MFFGGFFKKWNMIENIFILLYVGFCCVMFINICVSEVIFGLIFVYIIKRLIEKLCYFVIL